MSSPKCPDWYKAHLASYSLVTRGSTAVGIRLTPQLHIVPRLIMGAAEQSLPHIPAWLVQGQVYLFLFIFANYIGFTLR